MSVNIDLNLILFQKNIFDISTYNVVTVGRAQPQFAALRRHVVVVVVVLTGPVVARHLDDVAEDDVDGGVRAPVSGHHRREARPVALFQVDLGKKQKVALPSELHPPLL